MPTDELDDTDYRILRALQADGRMTNAHLAEQVHLSPSPCLRRLRRLESDGPITGYGARLDRKSLGWSVMAFVGINVERHGASEVEAFMQAVRESPQVVSCHALAGSVDFLLQVVARDLDDHFDLMVALSALPGVKDIQSSIAINEVKPFTGLPLTQRG